MVKRNPRAPRSDGKTCSICLAPLYAKGWCMRHYYRAARNGGDPLAFKVVQRYDRFDEDGNRWCTRCATFLHPDEFSGSESRKTWCRECRRLARYGLTRKTFKLLPGADGVCPICRRREAVQIDHDHACCPGPRACGSCNRGVLCRSCNVGLGQIGEESLMRAYEYTHGGKRI